MNLELLSERLVLRPFAAADADIAVQNFTDPDVMRYAGGAMEAADIYDAVPKWTRRGGNGCVGIWCIRTRDREEKLGSMALLPLPVDRKDTDYDQVVMGHMPEGDVEIGYFIKRSAWGRGYATEACRRTLEFAFEESPLEEVVATFDPGNKGSRNVLLKSGFVDHGTRRCYGTTGPDFRITRREWLAARSGAE